MLPCAAQARPGRRCPPSPDTRTAQRMSTTSASDDSAVSGASSCSDEEQSAEGQSSQESRRDSDESDDSIGHAEGDPGTGASSSSSSSSSSSGGESPTDGGQSPGGGEDDTEDWNEHLHKHGPKHKCPRCKYMRCKRGWSKELTYTAEDGTIQCWLEERCEPGHAWGLGCKVCRWHGSASAWGRGGVRGRNNTRFTNLLRHGGHVPRATGACGHRRHAAALDKLQEVNPLVQAAPLEVNPLARPEAVALPKDRRDVPGRPLCITAYKNAKAGAAFTMYTADIANSRASGASLPRNRESRIIAQRITDCAAAVLRDDDRELFRACTDIALTMDGRKSRLVVRARLCMGAGLPERFRSEGAPRLANMFGESIRVVDRLVSFRENAPFSTTEDRDSEKGGGGFGDKKQKTQVGHNSESHGSELDETRCKRCSLLRRIRFRRPRSPEISKIKSKARDRKRSWQGTSRTHCRTCAGTTPSFTTAPAAKSVCSRRTARPMNSSRGG